VKFLGFPGRVIRRLEQVSGVGFPPIAEIQKGTLPEKFGPVDTVWKPRSGQRSEILFSFSGIRTMHFQPFLLRFII